MIPKGRNGVPAVAKAIEGRIASGLLKVGDYLPSVRDVSRELGCASLTAHRAMRLLAKKGLVAAEPRHGYRLTGKVPACRAQEVLAVVEDTADYERYLGEIHEAQLAVIRRGALARGWVSASLPYAGQSAAAIGGQLREMGATALVLQDIGERFPPTLTAELVALGLPTVSLDMVASAAGLDQVLRDEAHGAALAAEHLLAGGHRRIGWYGPLTESINARRRFAGAAEVLIRAGLAANIQEWRELEPATDTRLAREYLSSPDRPKAVLALWQTAAMALARAARELGLRLGKDLDLVGWALEEHFDRGYATEAPELRECCATATWSLTDVGRLVLNRIGERRREPDLPAARILVPMRLREPGK